jgi:NADH dehydrogenase FAD-containing subunit
MANLGVQAAQLLAATFHDRFRVLLIEKNSHFQHLFAFPRFAVATGVDTHKAFIPFTPGTFASCPPGSGTVVQARVTGLNKSFVHLDRKIALDGLHTDSIPYSFLVSIVNIIGPFLICALSANSSQVIATGSKLAPPSNVPGSEKLDGVNYLTKHAQRVKRSSTVVVIGGGAVGVQMATDIKELYPDKEVTLVHSRQTVMNKFHRKLHDIIEKRCEELGINMKLGSRVKVPTEGYPKDGSRFNVEFEDGSSIPADLAVKPPIPCEILSIMLMKCVQIVCTGMVPQSSILQSLSPQSIDGSGFIRTLRTLQISDALHPNVFAIGDVADTGAHKAAKPQVLTSRC